MPTIQEEAVRVAKALKAAADSRKALNMPPRKGDSPFSVVIDGKALSIAVPWVMARELHEEDIAKYISNRLIETSKVKR